MVSAVGPNSVVVPLAPMHRMQPAADVRAATAEQREAIEALLSAPLVYHKQVVVGGTELPLKASFTLNSFFEKLRQCYGISIEISGSVVNALYLGKPIQSKDLDLTIEMSVPPQSWKEFRDWLLLKFTEQIEFEALEQQVLRCGKEKFVLKSPSLVTPSQIILKHGLNGCRYSRNSKDPEQYLTFAFSIEGAGFESLDLNFVVSRKNRSLSARNALRVKIPHQGNEFVFATVDGHTMEEVDRCLREGIYIVQPERAPSLREGLFYHARELTKGVLPGSSRMELGFCEGIYKQYPELKNLEADYENDVIRCLGHHFDPKAIKKKILFLMNLDQTIQRYQGFPKGYSLFMRHVLFRRMAAELGCKKIPKLEELSAFFEICRVYFFLAFGEEAPRMRFDAGPASPSPEMCRLQFEGEGSLLLVPPTDKFQERVTEQYAMLSKPVHKVLKKLTGHFPFPTEGRGGLIAFLTAKTQLPETGEPEPARQSPVPKNALGEFIARVNFDAVSEQMIRTSKELLDCLEPEGLQKLGPQQKEKLKAIFVRLWEEMLRNPAHPVTFRLYRAALTASFFSPEEKINACKAFMPRILKRKDGEGFKRACDIYRLLHSEGKVPLARTVDGIECLMQHVQDAKGVAAILPVLEELCVKSKDFTRMCKERRIFDRLLQLSLSPEVVTFVALLSFKKMEERLICNPELFAPYLRELGKINRDYALAFYGTIEKEALGFSPEKYAPIFTALVSLTLFRPEMEPPVVKGMHYLLNAGIRPSFEVRTAIRQLAQEAHEHSPFKGLHGAIAKSNALSQEKVVKPAPAAAKQGEEKKPPQPKGPRMRAQRDAPQVVIDRRKGEETQSTALLLAIHEAAKPIAQFTEVKTDETSLEFQKAAVRLNQAFELLSEGFQSKVISKVEFAQNWAFLLGYALRFKTTERAFFPCYQQLVSTMEADPLVAFASQRLFDAISLQYSQTHRASLFRLGCGVVMDSPQIFTGSHLNPQAIYRQMNGLLAVFRHLCRRDAEHYERGDREYAIEMSKVLFGLRDVGTDLTRKEAQHWIQSAGPREKKHLADSLTVFSQFSEAKEGAHQRDMELMVQFAGALAVFLAMNPEENPHTFLALAESGHTDYVKTKNKASLLQAILNWERVVLTLNPLNAPMLYAKISLAYETLGNYYEAIRYMEWALKLHHKQQGVFPPEYRMIHARLYAVLEDYRNVLSIYGEEKNLEQHAQFTGANAAALARAYQHYDQHAEAAQHYEKAIQTGFAPPIPVCVFLGRHHFRKKNFAQAAAYLMKVFKAGKAEDCDLYCLAACKIHQKDWQSVEKFLEQAIRANPQAAKQQLPPLLAAFGDKGKQKKEQMLASLKKTFASNPEILALLSSVS
jgi:tetratricopeptide (TPR) repeat protein